MLGELGATDGPPAVRADRVKFESDGGFYAEVKRRVREDFRASGLSERGGQSLYLKTATMLFWFAGSYALLVFAATAWWQGVLLSLSLALAMTGIGFSVQHDANHGASSDGPIVNRLLGFTLDLLGASSYMWHWKHNILHHTYTNIAGADHDLDVAPFGRLSPDQPWHRAYRFQHFYMWGLYGLMLPKWQVYDDFENVVQGRIEGNPIPRPRGWALFQLIAGKAAFFAWALVVPMMFHRWWVVLLFYGATSFVVGLILAVVFQLAHCLEEADFPPVPADASRVPESWAEHEVRTTVDFARDSRALTWFLGGLNYQVEHHLFPKISHVHYPRLARIVEEVCAEYRVPYAAHASMRAALRSHGRWLRRMGRPPAGAH
jgi:linoleoyl-CoA desaturase